MTLKAVVDGSVKTIAGRSSRPIVFINGEKKRLSKGLVFVDGVKKYLWGMENKIDTFVVPEYLTSGNPAPKPVYIDDKRLMDVSASIIDISNVSNINVLNTYSWGFDCRGQYEEDQTVYYGTKGGDSATLNEIVYNSGTNSALVSTALTFSRKSEGIQSVKGVRLDNGVWLSIYGVLVSTSPSYTYEYSLYKNNTKVADLGSQKIVLLEKNGNAMWAERGNSLYNITESGIGDVVYDAEFGLFDVCADGDGLLTSETYYLKKLDSQYRVIWDAALYDSGESPILGYQAQFIGKGKDGHCYMLVYSNPDTRNVPQTLEIKEFNGNTGELIAVYPFNYYDKNGSLILKWSVGGYISNSGYLALLGRSQKSADIDMYVARIFAG